MNWNAFKRSAFLSGIVATLFVAYLADQSVTRAQDRITLVIAILVLLLVLAFSTFIGMVQAVPHRRVYEPRHSMLTPEQRANALMFKHQPRTADFKVRAGYAEQNLRQAPKFYAINPDHQAFK